MNIYDSINRLLQLVPILNKTSDEATKVVNELEMSILGINVEAEIKYKTVVISSDEFWQYSLVYKRISSKFRLGVNIHHKVGPIFSTNVIPWTECTREIKVESISVLCQLLDILEIKSQELISEMVLAQRKAEELLKQFKRN